MQAPIYAKTACYGHCAWAWCRATLTPQSDAMTFRGRSPGRSRPCPMPPRPRSRRHDRLGSPESSFVLALRILSSAQRTRTPYRYPPRLLCPRCPGRSRPQLHVTLVNMHVNRAPTLPASFYPAVSAASSAPGHRRAKSKTSESHLSSAAHAMSASASTAVPSGIAALAAALRAPDDPPTPGGPSKIELAERAWATSEYIIPRKAQFFLDALLDRLNRARDDVRSVCWRTSRR